MTSNTNDELAQIPPGQWSAEKERAYLQLWFALARRPWMSVVLVPGRAGGSAEEAAMALAEVGQKVSGLAVRAVTMSALDYGTALVLSDLQDQLRRFSGEAAQAPRAIEVSAEEVQGVQEDQEAEPGSEPSEPIQSEAPDHPSAGLMPVFPAARFVIAVPCILSEPLGLAATQGADAVVVLVEQGLTRTRDVRRIVEQVGRDRVAGCFLVH